MVRKNTIRDKRFIDNRRDRRRNNVITRPRKRNSDFQKKMDKIAKNLNICPMCRGGGGTRKEICQGCGGSGRKVSKQKRGDSGKKE